MVMQRIDEHTTFLLERLIFLLKYEISHQGHSQTTHRSDEQPYKLYNLMSGM